MTLPIPSPDLPKDVQTVDSLGAAIQNLNAATVKGTAQGRMSAGFLDSAGGLTSGLVTTATEVFGGFLGDIVDDSSPTTVESPEDVSDQVEEFFDNPASSLMKAVAGDLYEVLTGIEDGDLNDLGSWINGQFDNVQQVVNQIIEIFNGLVVTPINSAIQGVKEWFNGLVGFRETVVDVVEEAQTQVVHVQQMLDVRSNRGLNEGPDPTAESSFSLEVMTMPVAHRHEYVATGSTAQWTNPTGVSSFEVNSTTSRWAFIRCWRDDPPKSVLSWMSWRTGAVTSFYLDVYKMETNGSYTWLASTDNLAGELTTVQSWMQFEIPVEVVTTPGMVIGVQFRASHPVNISGVEFPAPLAPWGFRPTSTGGVRAASDAPSTLSTLTMDSVYNGSTPFVQFGSDVGQVDNPRSFYDDFGGGIQDRFWKKLRGGLASSDITTESGAAAFSGGAAAIFSLQAGIYTRPLLTDRMACEFTVLDPHVNCACGVFLSSNWDMNEFVMLSVESDRFQLWTGSGTDTGAWTAQRTYTIATGSSSVWKLEYNPAATDPAYDPSLTANTYYVSRGGVALVDWTDSTNIVSHGRGRRFGGLMVTSTGFGKSGRIDNFNFYDVV